MAGRRDRAATNAAQAEWVEELSDREVRLPGVSIHESADAEAAGKWWADVAGVPFEIFRRPALKTHNPSTVRHNVGDPYQGCLVVDVPKSRDLYWRIEGMMHGIASAPGCGGDASM